MKAMVLAAGLGTRLRPLTDNKPKALVEIDGRTLLDLTLARLRSFGVREVIINVHHFSDMVVEYLKANEHFGMRIEISREDRLLDTGGGLKKAAWFFLKDVTRANEPFVLHNVDILSSIDLAKMLDTHQRTKALATLAVKDRETSRYLLFDDEHRLCGRCAEREGKPEMVRPARDVKALAFCGIHVISPRLLATLTEDGVFSIIDAYLRLARQGEDIRAFRADEYYWRDVGKLEQVQQATQDLQRGVFNS
jgi:NDP-sugar pyrophosphorylase family protein